MKNIFVIIITLFFAFNISAQTPQKMSYQTVVRDGANALVTSQSVGIQISILSGSATGSLVYRERHTLSTNSNGLASLEIGTGTVVSGVFANINWGTGTYFVKTETDPNGGVNYTISGTSQLMSVPYALHAKVAESVIGGGGTSPWTTSGNHIYTNNSRAVSIGSSNNFAQLNVNAPTGDVFRGFVNNNTQFRLHSNGGATIGSNATPPAQGLHVREAVGFGTSSPTVDFEIVKSDPRVMIRSTSTNSSSAAQIGFTNTTSPTNSLGAIGYADSRGLYLNVNGADLMNLKYTGTNNRRVGILTSSPSYLLHVNGSAGKPGGGSWTAASDKRLKDRITNYTDGLSTLLAIKPIRFHYTQKLDKEIDTEKEYVGVIAQDLKEVAPYMVGTFDKDGTEYYDVDNSAMTYMLINAVKEQQAQIKVLKAKLAKQEDLETRLELLETKLGLGAQSQK